MKRIIMSLLPHSLRLRLRAKRYFARGEPEVRWLSQFVDSKRATIDVGANNGVYAWWLSRLSAHCYAFEPNPIFQSDIQASGRNITPSCVALSNITGTARLFIPSDARTGAEMTGLATLRDGQHGEGREVEVVLAPLDSFSLPPIGFIKIDVEGHEMEVLEGALATIKRDRPLLLIEAEERHKENAVGALVDWFGQIEMVGFWLQDNTWKSVAQFGWKIHQNPADIDPTTQRSVKPYYNNFLFVPSERLAYFSFLPAPA
jgi:FkbM family methyltransferase